MRKETKQIIEKMNGLTEQQMQWFEYNLGYNHDDTLYLITIEEWDYDKFDDHWVTQLCCVTNLNQYDKIGDVVDLINFDRELIELNEGYDSRFDDILINIHFENDKI